MKESLHRLRRRSAQMPRRFWAFGWQARLWLEVNAESVRWNIRRRLGLKRKWRVR